MLEEFEGRFVSVADEWSGNISLSVEIINSFDHDGDGVASNQTGAAAFNFVSGIYFTFQNSICPKRQLLT